MSGAKRGKKSSKGKKEDNEEVENEQKSLEKGVEKLEVKDQKEKKEDVGVRRSQRKKKSTVKVGDEDDEDIEEEEEEKKGKKGRPKKEKKVEKEKEKNNAEKSEEKDNKEEKVEKVDKGKRKVEDNVDEASKKAKLITNEAYFSEDTKLLNLQEILTIKNISTLAVHEFEEQFDRIAGHLLNDCVFFVGGIPHRLTEVEFYCNGYNHPDHFAHGNPQQKTRGKWYFHMSGKSFRNGSFKGLDLTFGEDSCFGGILLRGLESLEGDYVDGPSLLVDRVLQLTDSKKIDDLVKKFDVSAENPQNNVSHPLYLVAGEGIKIDKRPIVKSARVGLTLKNFEDGKQNFIGKNYRYMSNTKLTTKGKHYTIIGLYQIGTTDIQTVAKATAANVKKCVELFDQGKSLNYKTFIDETLQNDGVCKLLGACHQFAYPSST